MKTELSITAVAANDTIQIFHGEEVLNLQRERNPAFFDKIFKLVETGNIKELRRQIIDVKKEIEKYTHGNFKFDGNTLYLKGDNEPIPMLLAKKLLALKNANQDYMPLIRFWKKLKLNPNKNVREQLYAFMEHENIPITTLGDVICEKGVKEGPGGILVDQRTGKIDNSIGMVVAEDRAIMDSDPNRTCSKGLHVAAPDFVRNHWSSGILIEVEVNPMNFVAIPADYSNTKARVCEYKVLGIASKEARKNLIYDFNDIIAPTKKALNDQKERSTFNSSEYSGNSPLIDFTKMTAQAIIDYVKKETGQIITVSTKNKKQIIKKAIEILRTSNGGAYAAKQTTFNVHGMSAHDIIDLIIQQTGVIISQKKPWRKQIIERGKKIFKENGLKMIDAK